MVADATPFTDKAKNYALSITNEKIPACLFVVQACERFLKDLDRQEDPSFLYYLDEEEAERRCQFLEALPHVKGKWAARREVFKLSDWQAFIHVNLFGWRKKGTEIRRFTEGYIEVPRKNGKSFWIAGSGLSVLCQDDDEGIEVYCGASTEKQAGEVFTPARRICKKTPKLRRAKGVDVYTKSIVRESIGAKFEAVIGDPGDGAAPSCAIADEYHEHKDSKQVDTMVTGMGSRDQPLMIYITTAGDDIGGPCYAKRDDVTKILSGTVEDDRVFGIIYTLDEDDDETTGLAFCPEGKRMYVAYQKSGLLFEVTRDDGLPFHGRTLDVKFHAIDAESDD